MKVHNPHALYYNGELIGIITNPGVYSDMLAICDALSPDEGAADAIGLVHNMGSTGAWAKIAQGLEELGVTETIAPDIFVDSCEVESDDEDRKSFRVTGTVNGAPFDVLVSPYCSEYNYSEYPDSELGDNDEPLQIAIGEYFEKNEIDLGRIGR